MLRYLYLVITFFSINIVGQEKENLIQKMSFYKDKTDVETIQSIQSHKFISVNNAILGLNNATFWFKVVVESTQNNQPLIFSTEENSVEGVEIYQNNILLSSEKESTGIRYPILKVKNYNTQPFYIKVRFKRQVNFPLKVYTESYFSTLDKISFLKSGFYYGFVAMVFIINLFFFFSLKDNAFFLYCIFLIAINLSIANFDGLSSFFIPSSIANYATLAIHFFLAVSGAIFATAFLDLKRLYPKSIVIGGGLLSLTIVAYILYVGSQNYIFYALGNIVCLLVLLVYWLMGVYVLKSQLSAKFFVIGYSLILFTALLFAIPQDFGITHLSLSIETVKLGAMFEALILTYAITHRVKILHQENAKYTENIKDYVQQIFRLEEQLSKKENLEVAPQKTLEDKIEIVAKEHALTEREADILLQIVNGLKNQEIADKLFVSVNTIKYHTRNIYEKLDVKKRGDITTKILFN